VPLSEQALREAGNFTICRSSAWTSRMITSAWWVESHQVSKTAPTGEYLTVGSFMIRGKKNFLPPSPLEMGLGVLFLLGDEESLRRHKNERRDFALMGDSDDDEELGEQLKKNQGKITNANGLAQKGTTKNGPGKSEPPKATLEEDLDTKPSSNGNTTNHSMGVSDEVADKDGDGKETVEASVVGDEDTKPKQKKKGLSARDRRLIKKYGSLEAAEKVLQAREEEDPASDAPPAKSNNSASVEQKSAKRGQKAKQKKMMKKYADQDEEDRELAMLALQGGEKINKKKTPGSKRDPKVSEKQQEVAAETVALLVKDASSVADRLSDEVRSLLIECITVRSTKGDKEEESVRWDKFDAETIEQLLSLEAVEAQVAAANRLLELKRTTRVDNFSASLGGKNIL